MSTAQLRRSRKNVCSEGRTSLWTKYFEDPTQWWDNRLTKINSRAPDFKHKATGESLWMDGCPYWVQKALRKNGLPMIPTEVKNDREQQHGASSCHAGGFGVGKENIATTSAPTSNRSLKAMAIDYVTTLKACAKAKDLKKGALVHSDILETGLLEKNLYVGSSLVSMYAKCGALAKAEEVLDELPVRNVVSWSALIAGYAQSGHAKEALRCYERMQSEGLSPDSITFICILKACGSLKAADKGKEIHDKILGQRLLEKNVVLGTALLDMYAKCGALSKAKEVLEQLPIRDAISWSSLIAGYAQQGLGQEALDAFEHMKREGFSPDTITFISVLKACSSIKAVDKGKEIHNVIAKRGLLKKDIVLGTALVDMYAKCSMLSKAQQVLAELPSRNAVSWNALIAGYSQQGQGKEALKCFDLMKQEGHSPNAVTFACILKACGSIGAADKGKQIHDDIVSLGLLQNDVVLGNSLVYMYAKCGELAKAREVLDDLPVRDTVSWSALIAGYAQQGHGEKALDCFEKMLHSGLAADAVTFACVLKACGSIGAIDKGKQIHDMIVDQGLLRESVVLGTALVDMYAKCGELAKAQEVLDELLIRDIFSWNALIAGYAQQGLGEGAVSCFERMLQVGPSPDAVTFTSVLNACSHSGLVDVAQMYYSSMQSRFGITPDIEHHTCMVDILGRAGHFDKAIAVIKQIPSSDHSPLWSALLGACRKWDNVELGRWAFENAIRVDKHDAAFYVCMANIYSSVGMCEEAKKIEAMRWKISVWKTPGRTCWIEANGTIHSFVVGDKKHAQSKDIYVKLQDIAHRMSQEGYSRSLHWVSQDIPDSAKKDVLCGHSEKLAIGCALINTPEGAPIRVVNNLRICGDCHDATSLISKLERRKIEVRDANRVHIFEDGKCSCGEYW